MNKYSPMKYLSIFIAALSLSCQQQKETAATTVDTSIEEDVLQLTQAQLQNLQLETATITLEEIAANLQLSGKIGLDPNAEVSISSPLGGRIASIAVLPGAPVKKETVLLTLEDEQYIEWQQEYLHAKAQLLSAEPNYERQKALNSNKSASDKALQQAAATYHSLLALKNGLEEKLRLVHIQPERLSAGNIQRQIPIYAPFDGTVTEVFFNRGKHVSPEDVLVELIDPKGLLAELKVFEKDIQNITIGQKVSVYSNSNPLKKANAEVISKSNHINEDGTAQVLAKFTDLQELEPIDGLYINAVITLDNQQVHSLPTEAIVSFDSHNYVFEQTDANTFKFIEVQLGNSTEKHTEILNHQELTGKNIVTNQAYALLMALKNKGEEE